jgi:peptide/nickel transport system ATP-binding protein
MSDLQVESLSVRVGKTGNSLLENISLSLGPGERRALIGRSGSGKSLLASSLTGLLRPPLLVSGGRILLDGVDLLESSRASFKKHRGRTIFHLLQNPGSALSPCVPIHNQIIRAAALRDRLAAPESAERALRIVGLWADARRYPFELSGGMRQRVVIAMALVLDPSVWIADEPTTGLDPIAQDEILDYLDRALKATRASLLFITHDLRAAARICPAAIVLNRGRVVGQLEWSNLSEAGSEAAAIIQATRRLER